MNLVLHNAAIDVPSNDVCPGRSISALPYNDIGVTVLAAANYTNCVTASSPDVVYTLNIPSCETVTASLCGSNFDTEISVRAGGDCPGTTLVACNDDNFCGVPYTLQSTATFIVQPNTNYYILIAGYAGSTGSYVLNVTGAPFVPPNDQCPGTTIAALPYSDTGSTQCGTHDYAVACQNTNSPDVVYNYTPSICQTVSASLCGSSYDCLIDIRAGGDCPGAYSVACNDNNMCGGTFTLQSTAIFNAYAGVTYYIIVSGSNGASGAFVLNVTSSGTFTPANDVCPGTTIASLPYTDINSTICDAHNYPNFMGNSSPDAVYNFTSSICQNVTVSLCGSGFDTGLSIYRNGNCPGIFLVAGNDDNLCGNIFSWQSTVGFQASAGVAYYILVHGWSAASGPYVINVTGQLCNVTAVVGSLVIQPSNSDIYLQWSYQGPAYYFNIYRSTSPTGLVVPANKIDSTNSITYYDINVLNAPAASYFYAVTVATLPTLLAENGSVDQGPVVDKTSASATSEPWFATDPFPATTVEAETDKSKAAPPPTDYIPVYDRLNTHYVPNPNKPAK